MDRLWTPWRYSYITGTDTRIRDGVPAVLEGWPMAERTHCVFCNMIGAVDYAIAHGMTVDEAEAAAGVVQRGTECFVCLNAYPYSNGHVMIVPYRHLNSLAVLPAEGAIEMILTLQRVERCLREVYRPQGLNFGMNLGEAAGAGVADHLHMHALPRWSGDTNFMTVTAETRVLPETLDITWARLRDAFSRQSQP
jgi:ATP adenylyltransferase